jgi:hypothetical protein
MAVVCGASLLNASRTALLAVAAIGIGSEALAQKPSQAQINAMRQSCRGDYMAHCSTVPTGGAAALNCLKQNLANLSPACQNAVDAIAPATSASIGPAGRAAPAMPAPSAPAAGATTASSPAANAPAAPTVAAPPPATAPLSSAATGRPGRPLLRNVRQACGVEYRSPV